LSGQRERERGREKERDSVDETLDIVHVDHITWKIESRIENRNNKE